MVPSGMSPIGSITAADANGAESVGETDAAVKAPGAWMLSIRTVRV